MSSKNKPKKSSKIERSAEIKEIILPSPEYSFEKDDVFGRKPFAKKLTKAIKAFCPLEDEAYVLSLNGSYGSGKTTFLRMWENLLQEDHKIDAIYINAWESDFDEEPLIPILTSLLNKLENDIELDKAAKTAMGSVANDFIAHWTGVKVAKAIQAASESGDIQAEGAAVYRDFWFKKKAFIKLKQCIQDYLVENEKILLVFVDELDRARPNYSIKFLETIKHIFNIQNVCFVLAIDRKQLQEITYKLYGKIDFENYFLRFVTRELDLPQSKERGREDFAKINFEKNFKKLGSVVIF